MSPRTRQAAQRERQASQRLASEVPWPLPLRGLLDKASTAEINGSMAAKLDNWHSNGISLEMRDGYAEADTEAVQQRIPFEFGTAPGYVSVFSDRIKFGTMTFARNFPNDVSHTEISANLIMADGAGDVMRFDGTHFQKAGFTTTTGKDPEEFNGVFSHHDRIYLWDDTELEFYYGAVGAVTGEVTRFPLSRLGNLTGSIKLITSMTLNASHGMNDILVIVTTTGWLVLYEGLDPGDANDWRLLGRVKVAAPVSRYAVASFGPDLWLLTGRGVVSVRDSLARGALALTSSVGKAISDLLVKDIKASRNLPGWQMHPRDDGSQFLINVPEGSGFKQYVFDVDAQAWSTSNYPARWWHDLSAVTGFTHTDGRLCNLADGDDAGASITATFHTSWIRLRRHTEIAYLIPTIIADGEATVSITVLTDHDQTQGDIDQAVQTITLKPDNPGTQVALNEVIAVNAAGRVFQARFEVTGSGVSFENLIAGLV